MSRRLNTELKIRSTCVQQTTGNCSIIKNIFHKNNMIIVLESGVAENQIEEIIRVLHDHKFDVHRSAGVQHIVLGAIGRSS